MKTKCLQRRAALFLIAILASSLAAGCDLAQGLLSSAPTATPKPTQTLTPTVTSTPTITPTATAVPEELLQYLDELFSSDPVERANAARYLGGLEAQAEFALDSLAGLLWTDFTSLVWQYSGDPTSPSMEAAIAIARIGTSEALDILLTAVNYSDYQVQWSGAVGLSFVDSPHQYPQLADAVPSLIAILQGDIVLPGATDGYYVQTRAAFALGHLRDPCGYAPLAAVLADSDAWWEIRWAAARVLWEFGDQALEPLLAAMRGDISSNVRGSAAWALGELGNEAAIEPLIAALRDRDEFVKAQAAQALETLTGESFGQDYTQWMQWWQESGQD